MADRLGIVLASGDFTRAHSAFLMAAGAAALGRQVVIFATGAGVRALCSDWRSLAGAEADDEQRSRGVAGFEELRQAVQDLGAQLIACESGLRTVGVSADLLITSVSRAGIAFFLETTTGAQLLAF